MSWGRCSHCLQGTAIGLCPKDKLFRGYIDLEIQLREFDRCRILYQKFLEFAPENCTTWMKYAELETILGDVERARAIFEIAISQPRLDMPEVIWKSYVDFEIEQEQYGLAARLYERLLERTQHVKVWISYAHFQLSYGGKDPVPLARTIFERANKELRNAAEKEERLMLLESWSEFEASHGDEQSQESVAKQMPKKVKKRRRIVNEDGPPKQKISDPEELAEYQLRKRKGFEDNIRKNRSVISNWIKYAQWEESQKRYRDHYNHAAQKNTPPCRNRQVNHARNIWDRSVSILPRVKQLWYKYTYMEEMLGNIAGARQVFERWMEWEPHEQAWQTYINFELRYKELDRARQIYERYILLFKKDMLVG
ncbi:hypothetical protein HPB51_016904 [Rhipicephalus microplus]|uniref:Pre-mRNA-splicing factor Syf1-like N-terminal HAT-repeats domain-containing protein n=1 Tax=Rhipicephalus microplus TaxID=6941 RepID=A0A9J6E2T1_RHIMP|nr:hypothetical protein HPB51_016904 [Rhipicephalus microplus]